MLRGSPDLIRQRRAARRGHFIDPALLHSQFEALEPPADAVELDVAPPPAEIAVTIRSRLGIDGTGINTGPEPRTEDRGTGP